SFQFLSDDYDLYMIKFAEYMINPKIDLIAETFDLITSRANLACQLFKLGCEKLIEEYITDFHLMPRSIRWDRELNGDTIDVFEQFP
ncbi:Hypothetical predicted protein, partial [Olea europaea subsp. europaea]